MAFPYPYFPIYCKLNYNNLNRQFRLITAFFLHVSQSSKENQVLEFIRDGQVQYHSISFQIMRLAIQESTETSSNKSTPQWIYQIGARMETVLPWLDNLLSFPQIPTILQAGEICIVKLGCKSLFGFESLDLGLILWTGTWTWASQ